MYMKTESWKKKISSVRLLFSPLKAVSRGGAAFIPSFIRSLRIVETIWNVWDLFICEVLSR